MVKLTAAIISKPGGRKVNEDFCAFQQHGQRGCFLVADGLGGHRGGEIASKTAGEAILEEFMRQPAGSLGTLSPYIEKARQTLRAKELAIGAVSLKTTLILLLVDEKQAKWAHIGDSRLYHFRSGKILLQTRDHSVPQKLAESGVISTADIRFHEDRNRLTAALSGAELQACSYHDQPCEILSGDAFLLCSDGFWEYVLEPEMETELAEISKPDQWLTGMERILLKRATDGHDNYSALAVFSE